VGTIIGDGIAQFTSRTSCSPNTPAYDAARASRLCTYAAVIGTPIGHYWFHFLDKVGAGQSAAGPQHIAGILLPLAWHSCEA
jgi:hypothetical protein